MAETSRASSAICTYTNDAIYVRDKSLVDELIGEVTFTQMMFFQIMARLPSPTEVKIVDAVLVTLLEHGITPSAIATRLTLMSAPESLQGAVAAGLLGVGGTFLGTTRSPRFMEPHGQREAHGRHQQQCDNFWFAQLEISAP